MATASPSGAQVVYDGENPRTFTGIARADITAGELVAVSGAAQATGSVVSTIAATDMPLIPVPDSQHCNGIALATVSSGTNALVPVARKGTYILRSAGAISGGQGIAPFSGTIQGVVAGDLITVTSGTVSSTGTFTPPIGRAVTASASGTNLYLLASLDV